MAVMGLFLEKAMVVVVIDTFLTATIGDMHLVTGVRETRFMVEHVLLGPEVN
jgi:hypothetical protein